MFIYLLCLLLFNIQYLAQNIYGGRAFYTVENFYGNQESKAYIGGTNGRSWFFLIPTAFLLVILKIENFILDHSLLSLCQ